MLLMKKETEYLHFRSLTKSASVRVLEQISAYFDVLHQELTFWAGQANAH